MAPWLSTSYVNTNSNSVENTYRLHPVLCLWITDWHFIQRQPTEWAHCHPTTLVKQCIMSPVKPLQCRSVTTHLFSQHSLASLSDCSLSSQNPALLQQQRWLTDALNFAGFTPSQGSYCFYCLRILRLNLTQIDFKYSDANLVWYYPFIMEIACVELIKIHNPKELTECI